MLISTQHDPGIDLETLLLPDLRSNVIQPLLPPELDARHYRILANPTGRLRAWAARTPTPVSPGARSSSTPTAAWPATAAAPSPGKDPSKVDRSAAYAARWVAKHVVAAGAATPLRDPGGLRHRRGPPGLAAWSRRSAPRRSTPSQIDKAVDEIFDLRPAAIVRDLDLKRPIYRKTAAYGHFGRSAAEVPWEATPRVGELRSALGL